MITQKPRMVADVGGTNTRLALFDPADGQLHALHSYPNSDFASFEEVVASWLATLGEPAPATACVAVAAPPAGDRVVMSNVSWSFSCRELAGRFGFGQFRAINDFEAIAHALPHLLPADRVTLHPGGGSNGSRLATMGPGTGLGGALLQRCSRQWQAIACEPGYMDLAPASPEEARLWSLLLQQYPRVYAELLVSGPGLQRLYRGLATLGGTTPESLAAAEITQRALQGTDPVCVRALEYFCALLGAACSNFVLANGSYGGLYLAGGILPRLLPLLQCSDFHRRFVERDPLRAQLASIPVFVITHTQPGLLGAAHIPLNASPAGAAIGALRP
ncbi:glucokinase [Kineobactrum salinum]|uniref:Glucokinase n=1 Tax=Kineobactrum salinum TaxID=2708301 RepID=A0A6C0U0D3_9GAMM|nr:glucokinase [Kineobactrum salinum]QIB65466.1 glucokinase [Kineobactrum salinum]